MLSPPSIGVYILQLHSSYNLVTHDGSLSATHVHKPQEILIYFSYTLLPNDLYAGMLVFATSKTISNDPHVQARLGNPIMNPKTPCMYLCLAGDIRDARDNLGQPS